MQCLRVIQVGSTNNGSGPFRFSRWKRERRSETFPKQNPRTWFLSLNPSASKNPNVRKMKTTTGRAISSTPVSLSKAAKVVSNFAAIENGASQAISAYVRRAAVAFNELNQIHREIEKSSKSEKKHKKSKSDSTVIGTEEFGSANHERKKHSKKHKDEKGGAFEGKMTVEDGEKPTRGELAEEVGEKRKHKVDGKIGDFEEKRREINGETGVKVGSKEGKKEDRKKRKKTEEIQESNSSEQQSRRKKRRKSEGIVN